MSGLGAGLDSFYEYLLKVNIFCFFVCSVVIIYADSFLTV